MITPKITNLGYSNLWSDMSTILDGGTAPTSPPPSSTVDEMYFSTTNGSLSYIGSSGDVITLSDGTTYTVSEDGFYSSENVPVGKHKVKLVETRNDVYVSIGGEALIELHNFPELSTITYFNFYPYISSPNLIKVPTLLPSNLTNVTYLFSEASSFNQDISNWNVSNVTDMSHMFGATTSFNQDLSSWCVTNITSLPEGFDDDATNWTLPHPVWGTCPSGENIPDSDFTKVTYIKTDTSNPMWIEAEYAPENINGKLHIDWGDGVKEVLNVADFESDGYYLYLEHEYVANGEYVVKAYSTTKAKYSSFGEITKLIDWGSPSNLQPLYFSSENLIEVPSTLHPSLTDLSGMFNSATAFNQDISSWNVSNVTDMNFMFYYASSFNQAIGSWDVSNVTNMSGMFSYASSFNQDLSMWCVSQIPTTPYRFNIGANSWTLPRPVWSTCPSG